jgi:hypothetical protein
VVLFRHLTDSCPDGDAPARAFGEVSQNDAAVSGHLYVLVFDQLHISTSPLATNSARAWPPSAS